MQRSGPAQGPSYQWRRAIFSGVFFLLFSTANAYGQDVAEAARKEQARKAAQQNAPKHVYTEEDLKRPKILTPEDQAKVEARKKQQDAAPAVQNAGQVPSDVNAQMESLGEVARRYRQEKAARTAEQSAQKRFTPFPYEVPEENLAAPRPGIAPGVEIAPRTDRRERIVATPMPAPRATARGTGSPARISPFRPRPLAAIPPALPATAAAPIVASPAARAVVPSVAPSVAPKARPDVMRPAPVNPRPSAAPAGVQRVQVLRGESWWKLAERYLGNGTRWPELRTMNAEAGGPPELLRLGSIVLVPERANLQGSPALHSIIIKKGDSLWGLARAHLGRGSAWTCLALANPQMSDYTHLMIGTSLQLPAGEALDSCRSGRVDKLQN